MLTGADEANRGRKPPASSPSTPAPKTKVATGPNSLSTRRVIAWLIRRLPFPYSSLDIVLFRLLFSSHRIQMFDYLSTHTATPACKQSRVKEKDARYSQDSTI
jgi:hypothetical protein